MIREVACCALWACAASGQTAAALEFEVASVKPSKADPRSSSGINTGHGRLTAYNVTLKRCIMGAYGVGPNQITGGPAWLDSDRFEIAAKAEQPANEDAILMTMLQSLLAERFKLALHRDTRLMRAYVLEVAKNGPKLEKADGGEASTSSNRSSGIIDAKNSTLDHFAEVLSRQMELPVMNRTSVEGIFNIKLQWTPEGTRPASPGADAAMGGPSVFTAIREQLGLRLRAGKVPVAVLVIDHAELPAAN